MQMARPYARHQGGGHRWSDPDCHQSLGHAALWPSHGCHRD